MIGAVGRMLGGKDFWATLYFGVLVYFVMCAAITALLLASPVLVASSNSLLFGLGVLSYNYGYLLSNCHQLPERSLFIFGGQVPLCSRDMGIYFGCIAGVALAFIWPKAPGILQSKRLTAVLMAPMVVDGVTQTIFFMRESSNGLRVFTGFLFGFAMTYFVTARVLDYVKSMEFDRKRFLLKAVVINLALLLALLAPSYILGTSFTPKDSIIPLTGENRSPSAVYYVSPRSSQTVRGDPYLKNYNDAVLNDIIYPVGARNTNGMWVVAYSSGNGGSGRFVYALENQGVFYYFDAKSGKLITRENHMPG